MDITAANCNALLNCELYPTHDWCTQTTLETAFFVAELRAREMRVSVSQSCHL